MEQGVTPLSLRTFSRGRSSAPELTLSAEEARDVIAAVGFDYKLAGFTEPGDVMLHAASCRAWLSPVGMCWRFGGISQNVMGPTFSLVSQVLGTLVVIRKIGVLGVGSWAAVSAIAGYFGVDLDADERTANVGKHFSKDPETASAMLEETLLEMLPAGVRIGIKRALDEFESGNTKNTASTLGAGLATVIPGASVAGWMFGALQRLSGAGNDAEPSYALRDEEKRELAQHLGLPYSVVSDTFDAVEDALTSPD